MKHDVLPVFCPNDFFWKNHWNEEKEEKWICYARVIRDIIAEQTGQPTCDLTLEDKLAYKAELKKLVSKPKDD